MPLLYNPHPNFPVARTFNNKAKHITLLNTRQRNYQQADISNCNNRVQPVKFTQLLLQSGPGSVDSMATGYGLDGPGIESRCVPDSLHLSRSALRTTQPPVQQVRGLSRGKKRPGRDANPSSILLPWSRKGRAIPLLPLWAERPVQSLSACTR